eukprot:5011824-Pleurochrysis_carterae.AAC.3
MNRSDAAAKQDYGEEARRESCETSIIVHRIFRDGSASWEAGGKQAEVTRWRCAVSSTRWRSDRGWTILTAQTDWLEWHIETQLICARQSGATEIGGGRRKRLGDAEARCRQQLGAEHSARARCRTLQLAWPALSTSVRTGPKRRESTWLERFLLQSVVAKLLV